MRKLIVANWKMHPATLTEAQKLFERTARVARSLTTCDVVICPPIVYLAGFPKVSRGKVMLGVQDIFWAEEGAYTGQVGPRMARSAGASYVILGHSERRVLAGDTDEMVAKKVRSALAAGLRVILCVGEQERSSDGSSAVFVKHQLQKSIRGVSKNLAANLIVVYEPVWAISSHQPSRLDTPETTLEMTLYIRRVLHTMFGAVIAKKIRVLYGGSVNAKNAAGFLSRAGVDGLLVGKASTDAEEFAAVLRSASKLT